MSINHYKLTTKATTNNFTEDNLMQDRDGENRKMTFFKTNYQWICLGLVIIVLLMLVGLVIYLLKRGKRNGFRLERSSLKLAGLPKEQVSLTSQQGNQSITFFLFYSINFIKYSFKIVTILKLVKNSILIYRK